MVYSIAAQKGRRPNWKELEHAIRRNFGGLDEINAVEIFKKRVTYGSDEKMQVLTLLKKYFPIVQSKLSLRPLS